MALLTGAECTYTRLAARRDPTRPVLAWTTQGDDTPDPVMLGSDRAPVTDIEAARGLDRPSASSRCSRTRCAPRRAKRSTSTRRVCPICGPASRPPPPPTPTRGRASPGSAQEIRSAGVVQPHGVVPLPQVDERQRSCRPGGGPDHVLGGRGPPGGGTRGASGSSRWRGPTPTTTGSSPTVGTCVPRPPWPRPDGGPCRWPGSASTTWPTSTCTRASRAPCRSRRARSAWLSTTRAGR